MNCLCCGKPLRPREEVSGWHNSCIRRFFGTDTLPEIEIDEATLVGLANESTHKGFTVPGVQKKLSLHLFSEGQTPRLTLVNDPTGYILKPQVEEFRALPEAEHLVMTMAEQLGIAVVPHGLIRGKDGTLAYITKRVDRVFEKNTVRRLAMEDFCQLDLRLTQDKYRGSYERCANVIERYSDRKGLDRTELFLRLIFSFLVCNSDMHLKNFSLLETAEGSGRYMLSPAYDLLPVNIVMPEDSEELALALNGKKTHIRRKDFLIFAQESGITAAQAEKMIRQAVSMKEKWKALCRESLMPEEMKTQLNALIEERCRTVED